MAANTIASCIIPAGQSLSAPVEITGGQLLRIRSPHNWDAAAPLTFQIAYIDQPDLYLDVHTINGLMLVECAPNRVILLPWEMPHAFRECFLKLRSGTPDDPVVQPDDCEFVLVIELSAGSAL
jgi:hypothetical protein